ncbi:MAG: chemotaxis protein CheW [Actinobacteria bacterium]|nr:chemotaxis protein CheW [Actinomycetota bacterium]
MSSPSAVHASEGTLLLSCQLDSTELAIPVAQIVEVLNAVALLQAPVSSPHLLGMIDYRGRLVPVADTRGLIGLPSRRLRASDRFVVASTPRGMVALAVDALHEITAASGLPADFGDSPDGFVMHSPLAGVWVLPVNALTRPMLDSIGFLSERQVEMI